MPGLKYPIQALFNILSYFALHLGALPPRPDSFRNLEPDLWRSHLFLLRLPHKTLNVDRRGLPTSSIACGLASEFAAQTGSYQPYVPANVGVRHDSRAPDGPEVSLITCLSATRFCEIQRCFGTRQAHPGAVDSWQALISLSAPPSLPFNSRLRLLRITRPASCRPRYQYVAFNVP